MYIIKSLLSLFNRNSPPNSELFDDFNLEYSSFLNLVALYDLLFFSAFDIFKSLLPFDGFVLKASDKFQKVRQRFCVIHSLAKHKLSGRNVASKIAIHSQDIKCS